MSATFTIDLWSDVVCPFCYLGRRQLALAVAQFEHGADVVVHHRAFELDPHSPATYDATLDELVAAKYALPVERAHAMHERLEESAAALGMTWSLASARPSNTFDAHRALALAATQGLADQLSDRFFRAYFCEGELMSDRHRLNALAGEVGVAGIDELWLGDAFSTNVRADGAAAQELGVTGVPSMLVDGRFMVVGAQGTQQMLDVLTRAWTRRTA